MTDHNPKIVARIQKLQALAWGSDNPTESANAAAAAQALMTAHSITEEALARATAKAEGRQAVDAPIVSRLIHVFRGSVITWQSQLFWHITKNNGCSSMCHTGDADGAGHRGLMAWGTAADLDTVEALWAVLPGRIDVLVRAAPYAGKTALNNFRLGVVSTIGERLADGRRQAVSLALQSAAADSAYGDCTALAVRSAEGAVERSQAVRDQTFKTVKRTVRSAYNEGARNAGKAAGHRVNLTANRALRS